MSISKELEALFKENQELKDAINSRTIELENKTRELEIEASLERVRTVAMGMSNRDDMLDICRIISSQLELLDVKDIRNVQTAIIDEAKGHYLNFEYYRLHEKALITDVDFKLHPAQFEFVDQMLKGPEEFFEKKFIASEVQDWYAFQQTTNQFADSYLATASSLHYYFYSMGPAALGISSYSPLNEEQIVLFKRFRNVFALAYRRYLDVENAYEQAREAQIEAALERVRSRTMAMYKTDELLDAAELISKELSTLGINCMNVSYAFVDEDETYASYYSLNPVTGKIAPFPFIFPHTETEVMRSLLSSWKMQEPFNMIELDEEATLKHQTWVGEHILKLILKRNIDMPFSVEAFLAISPKKAVIYSFNFSKGYLFHIGGERLTTMQEELVLRFTKVFEQTYTRFLDLQKAEAQSREAHIETSLERVRSRSMGMQKSEELKEVIQVIYDQFIHLNINVDHTGFIMDYKDRDDMNIWLADKHEVPSNVTLPYFDCAHWNSFKEAKEKGRNFFSNHLSFEEKNGFYEDLFKIIPGLPDEAKEYYFGCPGLAISTVLLENVGLYIENFSGIPYSDEENATLMRFGKVFQQTYTRFNDLQRVEAQTQKANIEVALERVRARALAMQQPEELVEVSEVMRHEMGLLGVEELETSSIYINKENSDHAECWYALKDFRVPEKKLVAGHFELKYPETWVGRQMADFYGSDKNEVSIQMQGANRKEWINYCSKKSTVIEGYYGTEITDRTYHLCKFSNGAIGAATPGEISTESWELLRRAASVFSLAYSRFKDLTNARTDLQNLKEEKQRAESALAELKTTQAQLIQSEKMASLGELTAGIAHEIQNPLNFINNFSEVNTELVDEMNVEIEKGDMKEVKAIADQVKQNLEKINHHGKRADAIVKGMLQHSRSSSATKEPTDINKLADEYLRLAYHGLRARDKFFNATMKTDYDETIENINIVPQDIGRVMLNLITNAFYATNEKKNQSDSDYEPTIMVSTSHSQINGAAHDEVIIKVKDNGNGIPKEVLDKIFQPFFTTKPTRQGTGLGLSLAYDIIKAHGGEIKVETIKGKGSEFIIYLPMV